jgi:predicted transcriptional regulator of viral defense system
VEDYASIVHELGLEQHSIVTWDQMRAAGVTEDWIDRQVRSRRLIREAPAAYRPWGVRRSWETRATAAVLSARAPALVSHQSAAFLWGIADHMPGIIDVTVPRHRRPFRRDVPDPVQKTIPSRRRWPEVALATYCALPQVWWHLRHRNMRCSA